MVQGPDGESGQGKETTVMDQCSLIALLGQATACEAGAVFREFLRGSVRLMLTDVMAAEVSELCGSKYDRTDETVCQRAGSAPGNVLWEGKRCGDRVSVGKKTTAPPRKFRCKRTKRPSSRSSFTRPFSVRSWPA
jgi:hypothetical protein